MASPSPSSTSLYQPDVESQALALLLKHGPEVWGEFHLIDRQEWSPAHRPLWDILSLQLSSVPQGSLDPLLLSNKLSSMGIASLEGGFAPFDYLEGLTNRYVEPKQAPHYARELKRLRVRRDLLGKLDAARKELIAKPGATFEEMTGMVEQELTSVTTAYHKPEVTEVWGNLIETVEHRMANPLKPEEIGFLGPFKSINETIGPLSYHGSYVVVGARSAVGKSSLGWFYNTFLLEKYPQLHLLHLDAAEMTFEELCWRAVCALSEGQISFRDVFTGECGKNPKQAKLIRDQLWPRVMKMKGRMSFKNVGNMSPAEKIAFQRRYYYNKVGRGNHLLIHDDYLKGVESTHKNSAEHQAIGYYVGDQKTLITDEIIASLWTSVQKNQSGISNGKKEEEVNDGEGTFALSDRIFTQSTHSFAMRFKLEVELARELNAFGNIKLGCIKKRQLLGKRYMELLTPVKNDKGGLTAEYFNLESRGFHYRDMGTYREMLAALGKTKVDLATPDPDASAAKGL
jgi:replicative DNA helicase